MTHLIKYLIILIFLIGGYATMMNANSTFKFYKSFITPPDPTISMQITPFLQSEADELYKHKSLKINTKLCKPIPTIYCKGDWEEDYYHCKYKTMDNHIKFKTSSYLLDHLGVEVYNEKICKSKQEWPFDSMSLLNDEFLITAQDGWYFVFKNTHAKTEPKEEKHKQDNIIPDDFFVKE